MNAMIASVILSLLGLILIYLEFFLPGGIFAIGGILLLVSSIFMLLVEKTPIIYFFLYSTLLLFFIFAIIKLALRRLKTVKSNFLDPEKDELLEKDLIGEVGEAFTDLSPTGKIFINETLYFATCRENFIQKGSKIQVVDAKKANLLVKEFKE